MTFGAPTLRQRFQRMTGSTVEFDLRPYRERLAAIHAAEPDLRASPDRSLQRRAASLRERAREGEPLDALSVEAFALVREASRRRLGLRPHDEQIIAGLALHAGNVVEMATGEGKTLAAVAPVFLNALTGRGVHVQTVNDYLARRDAAWMGPIYELLGCSVGAVQEGMDVAARQQAYRRDVTYVTAKEAGFDFLRGFLCLEPDRVVHRPFHFAIVDEADSILIDEARIPLVIAGEPDDHGAGLPRLARLARDMRPGVDYETDEHERNVTLSEGGARRAEKLLRCGNLYAPDNVRILAELRNALHAQVLLRRDVDYIVRDGRLELVDELTGRVVEDRQWPDGLQAALEAKEGLALRKEGRILGSISIQHFMQAYPRLAGMTATAQPAAAELQEFYGLGVVVIPPHAPCIRVDHPDRLFTDKGAKTRALVEEIGRLHASGRPVLVGTLSVAESEHLAAALTEAGVEVRVLNARNDEEEAEIVARAGDLGAVTISTNMAGRGTDIRLGGPGERNRLAVAGLGGLYVIGTNRHASRRIDDQLRGRAGRQGDPGASRFFVSLEDDLLVRFGIRGLLARARRDRRPEELIDDPVCAREVARVQRIMEGQDFETRRTLWGYSSVLEAQRQHLQSWRQEILTGPAGAGILAGRSPGRYQRLLRTAGEPLLRQVERRLTLLVIDRAWSDHLAEIAALRDGIHLVSLGGRDPFEEYHRQAREAFRELLDGIEDRVVEIFERIQITPAGVDWRKEGLLGPSSTWTYLTTDRPFQTGPLAAMAGRPAVGLYLAWLYAPFWIAWMFYCRWRRRRKGTVAG